MRIPIVNDDDDADDDNDGYNDDDIDNIDDGGDDEGATDPIIYSEHFPARSTLDDLRLKLKSNKSVFQPKSYKIGHKYPPPSYCWGCLADCPAMMMTMMTMMVTVMMMVAMVMMAMVMAVMMMLLMVAMVME